MGSLESWREGLGGNDTKSRERVDIVVTDGKGDYGSTESSKKDNSSGYVMKSNLNLSGAGL